MHSLCVCELCVGSNILDVQFLQLVVCMGVVVVRLGVVCDRVSHRVTHCRASHQP